LGPYTLRIVVRSAVADRTGSVETTVDIPDFRREPLSLSGVIINTSGGFETSPTTVRTFRPSDRRQAAVRIVQGGDAAPVAVTMRVRITDAGGQVVSDRSSIVPAGAFGAERSADYAAPLPLATLAPGEYWCSMTATAGSHEAKRDIRFVVK
jgi:hypothetical protein